MYIPQIDIHSHMDWTFILVMLVTIGPIKFLPVSKTEFQ